MIKQQYKPASSFWMDDWDNDSLYTSKVDGSSSDIYKLAAHKRAISNFTSILTGKNIPVEFYDKGGSYTDGNRIVISAEITEAKDFDVAVGLALHEASHIKLTDFDSIRQITNYVNSLPTEVYEKMVSLNIDAVGVLKDILNIVEDRRIDDFVFQSSPGYRDYYRTLYDKYFNDKLIDTALRSREMRDETVESYMFRLMNLHSEHTDLSALKRLREIYQLVDLKNINRLKTTKDALQLSGEILNIIIRAVDEAKQLQLNESVKNQKPSKGGEGKAGVGIRSYQNPDESDEGEVEVETDEAEAKADESDEGEVEAGGAKDEAEEDTNDDSSESYKVDVADTSEDSSSTSPSSGESDMDADGGESQPSLSSRQKELLDKKIKKQKDFLNGDVKKKKVTKYEQDQIKAIEESESSIEVVGGDFDKNGIRTVYVRNMTRSLMESEVFPLTIRTARYLRGGENIAYMQDAINRGISLGTILGKRLQVRGESRETVFNRQKVGKLDRRMISSLGFGNENVFFSREVDQYKKANLHISIDASGSMGGKKWENTMINVVALAKAVDMIPNLNIQISFRTTTMVSRIEMPYVVIAYDSRRDKFSKIKSLFQYLQATGTTPEGLCFEAMMKEFVPSNSDSDSYFMNISDGEPYFGSYSGDAAAKHILKQVGSIQSMGIKVLSYFVSDSPLLHDNHSTRTFKASYGKAASFIDVTNMVEVSKTMNQMFLSK